MNLPLKVSNSVFVAGEWVKASHDPEPVFNPATEEVIGLAPVGGKAEVDAAIAAARHAFDKGPWPRMSPQERGAKLRQLIDALVARKPDVMRLVVEEAGAVASQWPTQFELGIRLSLNSIEEGSRMRDMPLPIGVAPDPQGRKGFVGGIIRREPVGVVAAITPYNVPFMLNLVKLVPALITGNTVVLKPSPYTPFAALIVAEALFEIGLPKGVVSVITGGKDVGEMMTTDQRVDMITFTGSDAVGAAIAAQAAPSLKRLHLELGGKSAHIVRADANLEGAVAAGMGYLRHSGQGCVLTTRHLVHNAVRGRYVEMLAERHRALKIGAPVDPSSEFGPLIREAARARTEFYVEEGLKSGARLVTGGRRPAGFDKGYYYEPTLFDDVDNKSRLAQEEVFGPVGVVIGFDTDEEAIDLANDSAYGLGGAVWTNDLAAGFEMACAIRAGGVNVNGGGAAPGAPISPFGGFKRSGFGREWGEEGLNAYTELKSLTVRQV